MWCGTRSLDTGENFTVELIPVKLAEMRIVKLQVATNAVGPAGLVVACDLLPLEPVQGALVLAPRDFTLKDTQEEIR